MNKYYCIICGKSNYYVIHGRFHCLECDAIFVFDILKTSWNEKDK